MIRFNDPHDAYAIAQSAGAVFNSSVDQCIARVEDGKLMGGVLYQRYTGASIGVHIASFNPFWVNRDMLWVCFHYPFVQLGVSRVFGQVRESNPDTLAFDLKLGFNIVTKLDGVFPDGGVYIVRMDRDECRWLALTPKSIRSGGKNG
jgi:RimJ/RimL family protein N-acetyltransferase